MPPAVSRAAERAGQLDDVPPAGVHGEQDAPGLPRVRRGSCPRSLRPLLDCSTDSSSCGGPASRRSHRKNSTLPAGPGSGLATTPAVPQPRDAAAAPTSRTACTRCSGSRTTPPAPSRSRPTSNCGLTIGSRSASSGAAQAVSAGSTRRSEMNDRSATTRSTGPSIASGVSVRTLVRSWTRTRSSVRRLPGQLAVADVDGDDLGGAAAAAAPR